LFCRENILVQIRDLSVVLVAMKRYILHDSFNIYQFEADVWQHPVHNHTYFEIIFILKGKGRHNINGNDFAYSKGDVFLLGPNDYHSFDISSTTEFCYIRFMETFSKSQAFDKNRNWQQTLKALLHTPHVSTGSIVRDKKEKEKLFQLLAILQAEYYNRIDPAFEVMRDSLMKAIMTVLARNLSRQSLLKPQASMQSSLEDVLLYIRQNIYTSSHLRLSNLSRQFNYAPGYLSAYFKRHTGESLKQYIIRYKLKLIETRLLYSELTLTEIADEFGFSDESHLSKQFRKYTGVSPRNFRKKKIVSD
jgi:AraC family transcriptional regulator, L-rhamnose operon regulatory protein RhaS